MTETLHDGSWRTGAPGHVEGGFASAGIVVLTGEQEQRTTLDVDLVDAAANVTVDHVKVEVALEHSGTALHVVPERFPSLFRRDDRRDQAGNHAGANHAAMYVGPVEPGQIIIRLGVRCGFESDQRAEALGMFVREVQHDASADGAAHRYRLVETKRIGNFNDHAYIV